MSAKDPFDTQPTPVVGEPARGEIAKALAAAQCEMHNPGFDAANPHFKNKFASLAAVRNAVVPVMAKHGVFVSQDLQTTEGAVSCTTILTHSSGQQMKFGPYTLPVSKADAQGYGSASTYARRYHLMAVAGVVGDVDDDAETAVGRPTDEMEHPYGVLTNAKRDQYLPEVIKCLESGDDYGFRQLIDELNEGERKGLWFFFSTKQKAAARDMMQKKAAA